MLLGVVANPPVSESKSLRELRSYLTVVEAAFEEVARTAAEHDPVNRSGRATAKGRSAIKSMFALVRMMEGQVRQGVHVNGRGQKMSDHVQAIVYIHAEDGKPYVHGFGDAPLDLSSRGGALSIRGLADDTDVQMFAESNGSLRIVGRQGQPLWEDHD